MEYLNAAVIGLLVAAAWGAPARGEEPAPAWKPLAGALTLAFAPGSNAVLLLLDSESRPRVVDFADPARPKLAATLPEAKTAAYVADERIATGHEDGTIKLWTRDGKALKSAGAGKRPIMTLAASPSGRVLASLDEDHALRLWTPDLVPRTELVGKRKCQYDSVIQEPPVAFSADESRIAAASLCGGFAAWTLAGRPIPVRRIRDLHWGTGLAFSRDGQALAVLSRADPGEHNFFLPIEQGRFGTARKVGDEQRYMQSVVPGLAGTAFAYALEGNIVLASPKGAAVAKIPFEGVYLVATSSDGRRLAAVGGDAIAIWDETRKQVALLRLE